MALLERVSTLLRANINDLIDKAEDPEKMIKQIILDMENQLMQVKTQVAIAIADQHLLEKKRQENIDKEADWNRKAELAVSKAQDDLARAAIERAITHRQMATGFSEQVADQRKQVDTLRNALNKLEQKLGEAKNKSDLLIAQSRRAKVIGNTADAQMKMKGPSAKAGFERMERRVQRDGAISQAKAEMTCQDDLEDKFAQLEKEDEVERLLQEIKAKHAKSA